jgi:hypothetical protein
LKREKPDFVQVNYRSRSASPRSGTCAIAADHGLAVLINRPFMNGTYFDKLKERRYTDWAAEFDCKTWAEFSLKYILANRNGHLAC